MGNIDKKYMAKMLVHGISQTQIAAALGCTQGYISQLVDDDKELAEAISAEEAKLAEIRIKKDAKLDSIERTLLNKTAELAMEAESLGEAVTALQKVGQMRERQHIQNPAGQRGSGMIELNLSKVAEAKIKIGFGDNKVIMDLGGRSMARAPAKVVKEMVKQVSKDEPEREENSDEEVGVVWDFPAAAAQGGS